MEPIQEATGSVKPVLVSEARKAEGIPPAPGTLRVGADDLAGIAHDACNMLTALGLYCELLDEPGVLRPDHRHYVDELRMVAASGRKLVEKLTVLRAQEFNAASNSKLANFSTVYPVDAIQDLENELDANRNLLAALAGPAVSLEILSDDCHLPVSLGAEDLTRILVNLVKNACEAMPGGGRIELALEVVISASDVSSKVLPKNVRLTVTDSGVGIPKDDLAVIFESGYTTKVELREGGESWLNPHRGLGLAIVRSLVEDAGGTVKAESILGQGTKFVLELPTVAQ